MVVDAVIPDTGNPVAFVRVSAVGVPRFGVTRVGLVAKTNEPEPVSSVTAVARFAEEGVARNVAIPVPIPLTPVVIGNPVQFVRVPEEGVPRTGVVRVGDVSVLLVSVSVVALPTKVSVLVGRVNVPVFEIVEIMGDVSVLLVKVSVEEIVTTFTPSTARRPAEARDNVVSVA